MVSIVVLVFNGSAYLPGLFKSLRAQTYPSKEVIVIDNASTDGSVDWVRENHSHVRCIVRKKNVGFAAGNNIGIKEAKGEYVLCVNQDTYLESKYLEYLVALMEADEQIGSAQGAILRAKKDDLQSLTFGEKKRTIDSLGLSIARSRKVENIGENAYFTPREAVSEIFGVAGTLPLYRKAALDDVALPKWDGPEYFSESFFLYKEDVDLAWRMRLRSWKAVIDMRAITWHERGLKKKTLLQNFSPAQHRKNMLSFVNHHKVIFRCDDLQNILRDFLPIAAREAAFLGMAALNGTIFAGMYKFAVAKIQLLQERKHIQKNRKATTLAIRAWFGTTTRPYVRR